VSLALPGRRSVLLPGAWVRNELWRRARAVPSLDLRFAESKSLVDAISGQNLVTFTRASSGTFVGSNGLIQTAANDVPRFTHDPVTGECLGLLVEESRANLLLNSATLSTQSVTVSATAYTLSLYGTGTVTLSGTSTAGPLVGTGASTRVSLTFTPTAGSLTLTVSGSVTNANLEAGAFATSWIPTTGTTATRSADVASISGSNFSGWFNGNEGTMYGAGFVQPTGSPSFSRLFAAVGSNAGTDEISMYTRVNVDPATNGRIYGAVTVSSVLTGDVQPPNGSTAGNYVSAFAYRNNDFALSNNGTAPSTDTSGSLPACERLLLYGLARFQLMPVGYIKRFTYWPRRLSDSTLQALTL